MSQEYLTGTIPDRIHAAPARLHMHIVKVIIGTAQFLDSKKLIVNVKDGEQILTFDRIIIASGSVPAVPPIPGIDCPQCIDSTGALGLDTIPASLIIIGGGVIGVEMATLYSMLGSHVHIVEMANEILPMMDGELVGMLRADFARKGLRIHTRAKVIRIENRGAQANSGQEYTQEGLVTALNSAEWPSAFSAATSPCMEAT